MHFVILKNELSKSHYHWEEACKKLSLNYSIIELNSDKWLEEIKKHLHEALLFLACPSGISSNYKRMYDERIYIVSQVLKQIVFPSYDSILLHENKRLLSYWLKANCIPHPMTHVFYTEDQAFAFIKECKFPVVAKTNIGASGNGVKIFRNAFAVEMYIKQAFSKAGIRQKIGPNFKMGNLRKRALNFLTDKEHRRARISEYRAVYSDPQRDCVIFQEYIAHDYEWRIVRIGSAYFGHQKVKVGDKASGTKGIDYAIPPSDLFDFVKDICETHNFFTMAVDLFDNPLGGYFVNEMQCIFGHVQDFICAKDGEQGKFENIKGEWRFIKGIFNQNLSYNERLQQYINMLQHQE